MEEALEQVPQTQSLQIMSIERFVDQDALPSEKAAILVKRFGGVTEQVMSWKNSIDSISVVDSLDKKAMKKAGEIRKEIKAKRIDFTKLAKELKDDVNKEAKAIDSIRNYYNSIFEKLEEQAEQKEKFIQIQEAKERAERISSRLARASEFGFALQVETIADMADGLFDVYLKGLVAQEEERKQKELEEQKRIQEEKEKKERELEELRLRNELQNKRLNELLPYNRHGSDVDMATLYALSEDEYSRILSTKKEQYEKQLKLQEEALKEQQRLEKLQTFRFKAVQPYINHGPAISTAKILEYSDEEFNKLLAKKKSAFEKEEAERKAKYEKELLERGRRASLTPYWGYLGAEYTQESFEFSSLTPQDFDILLYKVSEEHKVKQAEIAKKKKEEEDALVAKRQKEKEERERAMAPDKEKLLLLANDLQGYAFPEMTNDISGNILTLAKMKMSEVVEYIKREASKL